MEVKSLAILGSTGSIGRSTLDVVRQHPGRFRVVALAAQSNHDVLVEQYRRFRPTYVCLADTEAAGVLAEALRDEPVRVLGMSNRMLVPGR